MRNFAAEKGYLTFAINTDDIDYVKLAYLQALSIKQTQIISQYAVVVRDIADAEPYKHVFDHVIELPKDTLPGRFSHEYQAWALTPFRETVKVESDILFTSNIDHWWSCYGDNDVVVCNKVLTFWGDTYSDRSQRKLFDENMLPDVYNGWTYFRYSQESMRFYHLVKDIYANWTWFRDHHLKNCRYDEPVTDEVFAIACRIIGESRTTIPGDIPTFVHMKNAGQSLSTERSWYEQLYFQKSKSGVTVGFHKQWAPFHYCDKSFITQGVIDCYE
jgi:hypothetical protein